MKPLQNFALKLNKNKNVIKTCNFSLIFNSMSFDDVEQNHTLAQGVRGVDTPLEGPKIRHPQRGGGEKL